KRSAPRRVRVIDVTTSRTARWFVRNNKVSRSIVISSFLGRICHKMGGSISLLRASNRSLSASVFHALSTHSPRLLLRGNLRLSEEQQVITATGLGIGATHVEPSEGMDAYQRPGAFTIDVEIPDV